jgi:SAM-dependent methyltransferase
MTKRRILRLFRDEKRNPDPFYEAIAEQSVSRFAFPLDGRAVLDLGCGPGYFSDALERAGARVVSTDLAVAPMRGSHRLRRPLVSDGTRLAFPGATFDGVFCSNVLEHTPDPPGIFDEIARVLRPGGWAYVSWTNWYSPWGGHAITPLHYLGPDRGLRAYRRLLGEPKGRNLPRVNLWVTYIGRTLRLVDDHADLRLVDAFPRYYPSQRWLLSVPGLREVATWNCVLLLARRGASVAPRGPAPA